MKRLLSMFSISTLIGISSINVISCKSTNELTKKQKTDIVNAINSENKDHKGNNIKLADISNWNNPQYKKIDKNTTQFTYDVVLKQNLVSFLTKDYRIPEIKGQFNIDSNNNIKEINYNPIYLPGNYYGLLNNSTSFMLIGNTNDFTLIMNKDKWWSFKSAIANNNVNDYLKTFSLYNSNINLNNDDWKNIMLDIAKLPNPVLTIDSGYAACINIIRNPGEDFKIAYTNLTVDDCQNMPLDDNTPWLPLFAFQASNDNYDGIKFQNNKNIILNINLLSELNDIYTSYKNNEDYGKTNWKLNSIINLLNKNKFSYDAENLSYQTIAQLLINLFTNNKSYNEIQNILKIKDKYGGIEFTFDKDNNYLENKLINVYYNNSKDDAIRYVKDHYDVKQILSTFNTGNGYDVQFINFKGQSEDKYVVYNNKMSFNDYKNNIDDVKKYFYADCSDYKDIADIRSIDFDHKWVISYFDIDDNLQVVVYKYDNQNAIFHEVD